MTERSDPFDQAVNALLRSRLEAKAQLGQIEAALSALGVDPEALDADDADPVKAYAERSKAVHTGNVTRPTRVPPDSGVDFVFEGFVVEAKGPRPSVRSAVQQVLDAEDRWFSSAELTEIIKNAVGDDRPTDKVKSNVRSSLWSLRKHGSVVAEGNSYKASKWLTDTDAASEETASASDPASKKGGGADEDPVRGLASLGTTRDQVDGLGAPVGASN